jgi:hypothetical protein
MKASLDKDHSHRTKTEVAIYYHIPFELDGEPLLEAESFMFLCGSAN